MTTRKDLKHIIRDRQAKTGESYTAARAHVMRERETRLGLAPDSPGGAAPSGTDAVVLKVGARSARMRVLGEPDQITFRSTDVSGVVPGQIVTLRFEKRWTWRENAYASGHIERPRIDVARLDLPPLPLHGGELMDLREIHEHFRSPDPYAPQWRQLTAKPRPSFEMDGVAWGAFPDSARDDNPASDAAVMIEVGQVERAQDLLMELLLRDLRCLDAHAKLGHIAFARSPEKALAHFQVGVAIGERSLPPGFDGLLPWNRLYNRPFLRCLEGLALCLWRRGEPTKADEVFRRIQALNPNDEQGVRSFREDIRNGLSWDATQPPDDEPASTLIH